MIASVLPDIWTNWGVRDMQISRQIDRKQWFHANTLQWRHNERDGVLNHKPHDCLRNRLFGHISKKTSKLCVTGLCEGNSPVTSEFPAKMTSNAEKVSIWWRYYDFGVFYLQIAHGMTSHLCSVEHRDAGGRLNKKDGLTRYGNSHVKDKTS